MMTTLQSTWKSWTRVRRVPAVGMQSPHRQMTLTWTSTWKLYRRKAQAESKSNYTQGATALPAVYSTGTLYV